MYGEIAEGFQDKGLKIYTKKIGQARQDSTLSTPSPQSPDSGLETHRLCLFELSMPTSSTLIAYIKYQRHRVSRSVTTGFYLAYHSPENQTSLSYTYHPAEYSPSPSSAISETNISAISAAKLPHHDHRLVELGTYISSPTIPNTELDMTPLHLMTIQHISIVPAPATPEPSDHRITNLRIATRGAGPYTQARLVWEFVSTSHTVRDGLPYSKTTGPFSHFLVSVNGKCIGRAYACEFPLRREDFGELESENEKEGHEEEEKEMEVTVEGGLFGGGKVLGERIRIGVGDVPR